MPRTRCQYSYEFRDRYYEDPPAIAATDGPDFRAAAARAKRMRFFKKGSGGGGSPSAAVPLTVEAEAEAVEAAAEGGLSPSKTATLVAGGDAASGGKGKRRRGGSANGEEEVLIRAQIDPEVMEDDIIKTILSFEASDGVIRMKETYSFNLSPSC